MHVLLDLQSFDSSYMKLVCVISSANGCVKMLKMYLSVYIDISCIRKFTYCFKSRIRFMIGQDMIALTSNGDYYCTARY